MIASHTNLYWFCEKIRKQNGINNKLILTDINNSHSKSLKATLCLALRNYLKCFTECIGSKVMAWKHKINVHTDLQQQNIIPFL